MKTLSNITLALMLLLLTLAFNKKPHGLMPDLSNLYPLCEKRSDYWESDNVPKVTLEVILQSSLPASGWYEISLGQEHQKLMWNCNADTCKVLIQDKDGDN